MRKNLQNLKYTIELNWDMESGGEAHIDNLPAVKLDLPKDFGGKGRFPCPVELFLSSVGGCLLTTFLYYRRKLRVLLHGLQVEVKGSVDLVGEAYQITGIEVVIKVETDEDEKTKAEECVELTKYYCLLIRVLEQTVPIETSVEIKTRKRGS
jgi:uncharacterized OsmC-like protein